MDRAHSVLNIGGHKKLSAFIREHPKVRLIQLQWIDYTSTVRVRVLTLTHLQALIGSGAHLALCRHYLALIDTGLLFTDRDPRRPAGQSCLVPDFNSIRPYPGHDEQAVVFCYFGDGTQPSTVLKHNMTSFVGTACPRRPLFQALQEAQKIGLNFGVGFELEFSCKQMHHEGSWPGEQVHASSGLRALESFMLPVLCTIAEALEEAGIPVQQFHCEGGENAYELVTGPMPPLEAADALTTSKETARRLCREQNIQLTFNPAPPETNGLHPTLSIHSTEHPVESIEDHFLAGVLEHMEALCAFALLRPESYERTVSGRWCAGRYVAWGTDNREVPIRKRRPGCWEVRLPDAAAHMYLFLAAVLIAGLSGIEKKSKLTAMDCRGEFGDDIGILPG